MSGIEVILAELENMDEEEQKEAIEDILDWAYANGYYNEDS